MSHHLVEARDLWFTYPDGTEALRGITFRITHGESAAIVGGNGAGKSTLVQHFNGYLMATQGEVRIGDLPLTRETLAAVRRTVGLVFQDPDDQLFMSTVFDDVAFGPLHFGLPPAVVEERAVAALERVGMLHLRERPPHKLSGGEKRAVSIATVLAMAPYGIRKPRPSGRYSPSGKSSPPRSSGRSRQRARRNSGLDAGHSRSRGEGAPSSSKGRAITAKNSQ